MKRIAFITVLLVFASAPAFAQSPSTEGAVDHASSPEGATTDQVAVTSADVEVVPVDKPAAPEKGFGIGNKYAQFSGRMQNLFLWRNDSDFDRTPPYYNAEGQDVGVIGTFIAPKLVVTPIKELKMVLEFEMGLNLWSAQDPDTYSSTLPSWLRLAMRQAYTEGNFFDGRLGFRVGYEQLFDPTGMFVGHWLGAASVFTKWDWGQVTLTVAQMPDQTAEGVAFDTNNFNTDTILYGARLYMPFGKLHLDAAIWGMHDTQVIDRKLDMLAITANFGGDWEWLKMGVDLGFQYGVTDNRAAGDDETTLAWAAQAYLKVDKPLLGGNLDFLFDLNFMALSGDDKYDGNNMNGAWFYSGKSRSRTLILTEDELRDRGGNIDELMSDRRHGDSGKYYLNRAGISVIDATVGINYKDFFRPAFTLGAGWVLNSDNALGSNFAGMEADLHLEFMYKKYLSVDFVGSVLLPGAAAAAFVNTTDDRSAVDTIYQFQTSVMFWF